jgi:hypothetical protein
LCGFYCPIYCYHDNAINADYFYVLVQKLKEKGIGFISLDKALKDEVYAQKSHLCNRWGISWVFCWMPNNAERMQAMKNRPLGNCFMMNIKRCKQ